MKIGILSMQRICNYGSFMQSYALKKIIESLGHEVEFVDYRIEKPISRTDKDRVQYIKEKIRNLIIDIVTASNALLSLVPKSRRDMFRHIKRYREEFLPLLGVSKSRNYNAKVDALIIGSDEVFNCLQRNERVGYSRELFGLNNNAKKLMSYAASFGNTTLEGLKKAGIVDEISNMLLKFDTISVRDKNSGEIVKKLRGNDPIYNLDPVLIYDFSKEIPSVNIMDGYIVVYAYRNRLSNEEIEGIKNFALKKKKRLICLGGYQSFCDQYIDASPFELLSYVKNADCVITDTFHGSIFSIINHKQFVAFVRKSVNGAYGNQEKMGDLLKRLGLSERGISDISQLEDLIEEPIDYNAVEERRNREINKTIQYLKENLQVQLELRR